MSIKKGGLGRNLSALLSHTDSVLRPIGTTLVQDPMRLTLPVERLQPGKYQPRNDMDDQLLQELSESIKKQGLLQPLLVRAIDTERYEIIAGERRWRACKAIGMADVPVVVRQVDDKTAMAMALVENLQREDLTTMDQARAMQRLINEFDLTHQQIAELLCKSRAAVSNYLRLLHLCADVQRMLENGDLDMGHARSLLMLNDAQQLHAAQLVVDKTLSVRETEALVARLKAEPATETASIDVAPLFTRQLETLAHQLQTKVKLKQGKTGKGSLIIHYNNKQALEKMIEQLMK